MLVGLFVVFVFSFLCTALQQRWLVTDLLQEQMSVESGSICMNSDRVVTLTDSKV